jgi:hypothetical protein
MQIQKSKFLESAQDFTIFVLPASNGWHLLEENIGFRRWEKSMENASDSEGYSKGTNADEQPSGWLRVGVVAAASALAGGLAVAWWYRKTLKTLRQTEEVGRNPYFNSDPDHGGE